MMHNKVTALNFIKAAMITLLIFSCMPSSKADEVDTLIQELKDKDPDVREGAAEVLVKIGAPAVEPLIAALKKDKDPNVRWWAAWALGEIKDARTVKPLITTLKNEDPYAREAAAEALVKIGTPAVEPLLAATKDKDPNVRWWAEVALEKIKARLDPFP